MRRSISVASFLILGALSFCSGPAFSQNLLPDPTFSSGVLGAWAFPCEPYNRVVWSSEPGADGAPGFARFSAYGPGSCSSPSICVAVSADVLYSASATVRLAAGPRMVQLGLGFFSSPDCHRDSFLDGISSDLVFPPPDTWQALSVGPFLAPHGAVAARFAIAPDIVDGSVIQADFDNVSLSPLATATVPALGTSSLVFLGLALAASGVLALTALTRRAQRA